MSDTLLDKIIEVGSREPDTGEGKMTNTKDIDNMYKRIESNEFGATVPHVPHRENSDANRAWRESVNDGVRRFRVACEEVCGVAGHPKAGELWSLAWSYGHSTGLHDVYNHYVDMAGLLR